MRKTQEEKIKWLGDQLDLRYAINTLHIINCGGSLKKFAEVECDVCGYHHYFSQASNLLYKARREFACPNCQRECSKKPKSQLAINQKVKTKEQMEERLNRDFKHNSLKVLSYSGVLRGPVTVECSQCGFKHTYKAARDLIYKKNKEEACPKCAGPNKPRVSQTEAQQRIDEIFGINEFIILKYEKASAKILLKHNKCGFCFTKRDLANVEKMLGCPKCDSYRSKGEKEIASILLKWNIPFETEKTFSNLKGNTEKALLRFDFCIMKDNVPLLIEFDGQQHYEIGPFNTTEEELLLQQINDHRKDEFCANNHYPLLRIPYWDFKRIPNIIKNFLILNDYPLGEQGSSDSETLNTDR